MAVKKQSKAGNAQKTPAKAVRPPAAKAKAKPTPQPKKAPAKKTPEVKTARKDVKPPVKKATPKKTLKKTVPLKPVKKIVSPKTPDKKPAAKKPVVSVKPPAPAPKPVQKAVAVPEPKKQRLNKGDLDHFKAELLSMRDRITGQSGSMRNAALQRNDEINPEEDGTDAFMRLQTLEQVSSQQQIVTNIDEALRTIEKGAYGVCDMCGELIGKARLTVLPFAKNCIKCQSEMERPRHPGGRR